MESGGRGPDREGGRCPELIQGNVKTDDFARVWEEKFQEFRSLDMRKAKQCEACPDWFQCRGDSMHTWDFDQKKPSFCLRDYIISGEERILPDFSYDKLIKKLRAVYPRLSGLRMSYAGGKGKPVVFTPNAAEELFWMFHWGKRHPVNLCEQLGFLHSHPGELDVAPSEADVDLNSWLAERENLRHFVIVNPQKKKMAAYYGTAMQVSEVTLLGEEPALALW